MTKKPATDMEKLEMMMYSIRLMRSGNFKTVAEVKRALIEDFPSVDEKDAVGALADAAKRMIAAQY